ncbi:MULTISPECIES: XRE family transcriptional regulator [Citromicrobium]|uniref:XRE family transcriptional regulator n=1 Tax=Citromicrobium TaxID=72173 RepID=UPI000AAFEDC1|nr:MULTISPECIES: LexA family transcriptional regulator [Citromicrobium]
MSEGAPQRLREERERLGLSQKALGELGGVSKNTQLAYEGGNSPITLDYLARVSEHGIDIQYVASNHRSTVVEASEFAAEGVVEIDEIDMRYGMGASDVSGHVEPAKRIFSREWLQNFTDARPGQLYWAIGQGDSMEPTISSGDLILIDRSQDTMFDRDLIWACTVGDFGMIKRLRPTREGVTILSDNPAVPDDFAVDDELRIIGRVIAKVGKL